MTSAWQHHDHQSCKYDNTKGLHDHRGNLREIQAGVWKEKLDEQIIWIKNIQTELLADKPRSDSVSVRLPLHLETLPAVVTTTQDRWGRWINYWASHFNIDEDCLSGSMFSLLYYSRIVRLTSSRRVQPELCQLSSESVSFEYASRHAIKCH